MPSKTQAWLKSAFTAPTSLGDIIWGHGFLALQDNHEQPRTTAYFVALAVGPSCAEVKAGWVRKCAGIKVGWVSRIVHVKVGWVKKGVWVRKCVE